LKTFLAKFVALQKMIGGDSNAVKLKIDISKAKHQSDFMKRGYLL
jgi:hypothetical protein